MTCLRSKNKKEHYPHSCEEASCDFCFSHVTYQCTCSKWKPRLGCAVQGPRKMTSYLYLIANKDRLSVIWTVDLPGSGSRWGE